MCSWIWSHLALSALITGMLLPLIRQWSNRLAAVGVLFTVFLLTFLPVGNTNLAGITLAHVGTISVSMIALILFAAWPFIRYREKTIDAQQKHEILVASIVFAASGIVLYSSALGVIDQDFYSLGYDPGFAFAVLFVSLCFAFTRHWLIAFCLVAAVIGHGFRVIDSANGWHCLLDPWLVLYAMVFLLRSILSYAFSVDREKPTINHSTRTATLVASE